MSDKLKKIKPLYVVMFDGLGENPITVFASYFRDLKSARAAINPSATTGIDFDYYIVKFQPVRICGERKK